MTLKEEREKKLRSMTREAIRNAVLKVMADHGEEGITMQRVAEEAGVAKGTLYLYFDNKEDLLEDTVKSCFDPLIEGGKEIFEADLEPDEKIARVITYHHNFFQEHQQLFRMLLIDQQYTRSKQKQQEHERYKKILQKVANLIQEGIDKNIFKEVNPMVAAVILMESSMALTYQFLKPGDARSFSSDDAAKVLKEVFLGGILK
ncbi:MAG TPA: TetR/AcrR family transcriptional regulator [Balneolaceae bacterium]|nr:TetR/AcrR family transcriptional regulator [Balneolaceae bacterium]